MNEKIDKGTRKRMRNIRENKGDLCSVDLKNIVEETLKKLKLPLGPTQFIYDISKVAPNYFSGFSVMGDETYVVSSERVNRLERRSEGWVDVTFDEKVTAPILRNVVYCDGMPEDHGGYYSDGRPMYGENRIESWMTPKKAAENIAKARQSGKNVSTIRAQRRFVREAEINLIRRKANKDCILDDLSKRNLPEYYQTRKPLKILKNKAR